MRHQKVFRCCNCGKLGLSGTTIENIGKMFYYCYRNGCKPIANKHYRMLMGIGERFPCKFPEFVYKTSARMD